MTVLHVSSCRVAVACCLLALPEVLAQPLEGEHKREEWQRVPEIAAAMGIREGATVADVGAGYGFLVARLATIVGPNGKVYAVDVADDPLKVLRQRVRDSNLNNVEVITGAEDDPRLPTAILDAAVIVNAYHEMKEGQAVLRRIAAALKPGGRLVVSEPWSQKQRTRAEQIQSHIFSPDLMVEDLELTGFKVVERLDEFTRQNGTTHFLIVAEPNPRPDRSNR